MGSNVVTGRKVSLLDWVRVAFALVMVVVVPGVLVGYVNSQLPIYEYTVWFMRVLCALPATLVCAAATWPPVWLVCRRTVILPLAAMFAVIYTPVSAFMFVSVVNVGLDREPGRVVSVTYVRFEDRAKGADQDVVRSWHDPSSTIEFPATLLRQSERVPGKPVSIMVHRGWLGLEWVSRASVD